MTIVLLASVSLFALVVTSRPVVPSDADLRRDFVPSSSTLQASVQTPLRIEKGKNGLTSDAARFHFQKSKQQIDYFSELVKEDDEAVAAFQISSAEPAAFGGLVGETAHGPDTFDVHDYDNSRTEDVPDDVSASEPVAAEKHEAPTDESSSTPLVVLAFSCVAALLALACVSLSLHIIKSLRSQMLASKTAWNLLPRFWRRRKSQESVSATVKQHLAGGDCLLLQVEVSSQGLLDAEEGIAQRFELHPGDRPLYFDAASDIEPEWDGVGEKYQDALDMTPLLLKDNVSHPSHFDDPPLPPVGCHLVNLPLSDRRTPLMSELSLSLSLVSRPTWLVRAMDFPAPGLPSRHDGVDSTPQSLVHLRRAYRAPVPELDIALAMQLRPGFGIAADSAWMVRFLMAIFGWFAVALTGNAR